MEHLLPAAMPASDRKAKPAHEDPRTTFREVQAQDVVTWLGSIYRTHAEALGNGPDGAPLDKAAVAWFFDESDSPLSFNAYCAMHGQDPGPLRAHLNALIKQRKQTDE